ncbi:MAG TPA: DNA-formamidopyrimidine glycosylase family protein [Acidimicrobiia bacterium]|nr:DNA-formamidopyrimidine glycosylase family protein [Acidimicrobiia bacterium]
MPELPDIVVYIEALERRVLGATVAGVRVVSPAVMRTYDPPYDAPTGRQVESLHRVGKRIVFGFADDNERGGVSTSFTKRDSGLYLVIHLMVAGRLRWEAPGKAIPRKVGLAAFDFEEGSLILTEQGTHKRAGIWLFRDWEGVESLDRGGIEPLEASTVDFAAALRAENRTLKRALTDPRIFSGIGNAYSDEILWSARLSPVKRTAQLSDEEMAALHEAVLGSLGHWTATLRDEVGDGWPTKVTAFRDDMAVHGKYGEECPRCGSKVQRIVYSANETNYCATCQTGGKLLADRSLSRLLKDDWPKTLEELEEA